MIDRLIAFSIQQKLLVGMLVLGLICWGVYSLQQLPIDAVPDITTNQVQVITRAPTLATQEVEQFVTFPIEVAMANLPDLVEIRSISRFGISVVTVVLEEHVDIYHARQLISEQLRIAEGEIPEGFGNPELGPITTGLGEVYQYVLHTEPGYDSLYSDMDLRTINDWLVKRQLAGTPGVIEVSGWGGHLKQYEVAVNPEKLNSMHVTIAEVFAALEQNNENTGGSYIENRFNTYFIRGDGLVRTLEDIENIVVKTVNGLPVLVRHVATVGYGSTPRYGALTYNGQGEVVGGQALMLKGANSFEVVNAIKERVETIRESLPEGIVLEPFIDRSKLVKRTISTVTTNLIEGGIIVILILVLLLGNFRGGLIVASVIPLAMLFAIGMMNTFGVSANLMSLGAIDFGLIVDGSVIIVEAIVHRMNSRFAGQRLTQKQMDSEVMKASSKIRSSAAFGEIIILIVYLPLLALVGIEGKMFKPMAQTVSFAILGALILSMTYVPMMTALLLPKYIRQKKTWSDRFIEILQKRYEPLLQLVLKRKVAVLVCTVLLFGLSLFTFNRLGGEFIPTMEEGDFALHQILPPGSSLQQSVEVSQKIQQTLLDSFPEVDIVVSKIGTSEIPTDPMPIEVGDIMVTMKDKKEWVSASGKEEMFERMEAVLTTIPGVEYEFTQPIQMRFNELIAGVREDIAIKLFGENPDVLFQKAQEVEQLIQGIEGVGDLRVEQTQGLPQMMITYERNKVAQYGLTIRDLNLAVRASFAGEKAGVVFEGEKRFDLVVRLEKSFRGNIEHVRNLFVGLPNGQQIPLKEVARIEFKDGPMQISRENARRKIIVGVNARGRDMESLVYDIQQKLDAELELPPGYYLVYGGQFENLREAKARLSIVVPAALLLILVLLYLTFKSFKQALLIFTAIPLSAIGGIYALWLRDMPFSISAGVGFIALFGVAVLNGIVLIASFNALKKQGVESIRERIVDGAMVRLRPVLMTAAVAALGFLPMALSTSAGAEVQRPLATVVIGGLLSATLLTLLVLPVLYALVERFRFRGNTAAKTVALLLVGTALMGNQLFAQEKILTIEEAVQQAQNNHPAMTQARLEVAKQEKLKQTAFALDRTRFNYATGQLNSRVTDYQFQVSQGFLFPTAYIGRSRLQKEAVALSEVGLDLAQAEMELQVRQVYWQLAHAQARLHVLEELEKRYSKFAEAAQRRYQLGDIGRLENLTAKSKAEAIALQFQQAEATVAIARKQLQQWIGEGTDWQIPEGILRTADQQSVATTASPNAPDLRYVEQQTKVSAQALKVARAGYLPDLSIGYVNQQIEGVSGLSGFQFGVGLPLFFWTQQGKIGAARLEQEQKQAQYQAVTRSLDTQFQTAQQELIKAKNTLNWYTSSGLETAEELSRTAEKGYREGEIGYLEYVASYQQALDIKLGYLDGLLQYQQASTMLDYLSGAYTK